MKYSIIIPTHNYCDDLLKPCVESVLAHTHMDETEVIVSADACVDNTHYYLTRMRNHFVHMGFEDHFHVIEQSELMGFAHVCNQAVRQAQGEYLIILQPTCVIQEQPRHAWVKSLTHAFENTIHMGMSSLNVSLRDQMTATPVPFDCVMMPKTVWHQVGELTTHGSGTHAYADWCVRMQAKGLHLHHVQDPHTLVVHTKNINSPFMSLETNSNTPYKQHMSQTITPAPTAIPTIQILDATQVAHTFEWLKDINSESEYLFNEVIKNNTYKVNSTMITGYSVIDVGANQGMFSILAAAMGAIQVLACEPIRSTHSLLCENVQRSQLPNIQCVHKAVMGKCTGPLMISVHEESGHNSLYKMGQTHELVNCVSLQELVNSCSQPQIFLKMDCEGAEYDIILDSDPQVFDRIKYIGVEIHGDMHPTHTGVEKLQQAITQLGFTLISREQVGTWYWNAQGEVVRFDPLPQTVEVWGK